ncbi:FdtA/QdtA family cupin domain-containing protein [bacterium]|jgi:dTDP-4-dehydrorhamnose 3,5-epimerase-like enzyme|nr:FdtA/QdtA family cupin domain-containing protein [bacterium]
MSLIEIIDFEYLGDDRGSLVALEGNRSVPFDIKRVYYIYSTKEGVSRGFHAHHNLKQVAVCLAGSCRFVLDDGKEKEEVILDNAVKGLLVDNFIWHEMYDLSSDCVLMVLASDYYNESDYIRDYQTFLKIINND